MHPSDDNNFVVLIHPTPEGADTTESDIIDQEVVDTMGDDILEVMESKNDKMYDDSDSLCGGGNEMNYDT